METYSLPDAKLGTDAAAAYLGLTLGILQRLRATGDGPRYAKLGKRVVYDKLDLDSWFESKKRNSTSEAY